MQVSKASRSSFTRLPWDFGSIFNRGLFSREDERLLTQRLTPLPIKENLTISANVGLNYCPFCGTNLQKLITRSTIEGFQALAEQHSRVDELPLLKLWEGVDFGERE